MVVSLCILCQLILSQHRLVNQELHVYMHTCNFIVESVIVYTRYIDLYCSVYFVSVSAFVCIYVFVSLLVNKELFNKFADAELTIMVPHSASLNVVSIQWVQMNFIQKNLSFIKYWIKLWACYITNVLSLLRKVRLWRMLMVFASPTVQCIVITSFYVCNTTFN